MDQFLGSVKATLGSLVERYTGAEITDKLGSSILATVFRQLVMASQVMNVTWLHKQIECSERAPLFASWQMIFLLELCPLDIPHSVLLKSFSSLVELLKGLSTDTGDIFSKVTQL